jgi:hypothetical protein
MSVASCRQALVDKLVGKPRRQVLLMESTEYALRSKATPAARADKRTASGYNIEHKLTIATKGDNHVWSGKLGE